MVLLAIVAGVLFVVPSEDTYIVLPDRARPVEPLVEVQGAKPPGSRGGIYFVDVIVRKATLLERFVPGIHDGATLVKAELINPSGVSERVRRRSSLHEMTRSQRIAAAVALRSLGYPVRVRRSGALIEEIVPGRPAARQLKLDDVVVAADGRRVHSPQELRSVLSEHRPGSVVALRVQRGSRTVRVKLRTVEDPQEPGRALIGVLVDQAAVIRLPRRIEINSGNIGGPSAGLAFALDVRDELGRDVDHGKRVAVTGALDLDGHVLPVGGIKQKTIGARKANVDLFVVPAGENAAEARANADGLRIVPVRSFQQALRALATATNGRQS
jgi:PDZ domain-containing protein